MRKLNKILPAAVVLLLLFSSCEKTIDFTPAELEPKIVVNSMLMANEKITVRITKSESRLSDKLFYEPISNAKADLYVNDEFAETLRFESRPDTFIRQLSYSTSKIPFDKGVFVSETIAEPGKSYRLEVSCEGMDNANCETRVPYPVEIISVDTFTETFEEQTTRGRFICKVKFKDPANYSNYYRFEINNTRGEAVKYYTNNTYVYSDTILLHKRYISPYYFDDPIFKHSENEANDIVLGTPNNRYSIFDDSRINGLQYTINTKLYVYEYGIPHEQEYGNFTEQRFILFSISKNYFDYLNTANYHFWFAEDYFAEPVQVYSNINGGLGIWASANCSKYTITKGKYPLPGKVYMPPEEYYKDKNYGGYGYSH